MTFSRNGRFICRPGSRMTRRGWPNCRTSASSVWSTMKSGEVEGSTTRIPRTIRTIATGMRTRRFTTASSLTPQWGDGGGRGRPARAGPRRVGWRRCGSASIRAAERRQRQIRKDAALALGRFVDDHLVAVLQDLFHRFEVEALLRHILGRLEGVVDREEPIRVALRARGNLLPISFGLLLDPHRVAAGPRDDVVAVGFGFVAQTFAIGERALHVAERVDDRRRRVDLQQLQLGDFDPGAVKVEDSLQQSLRVGLDLAAAFR